MIRVGDVLQPHGAHRPESSCSASGETFAHLLVKQVLADHLRAGGELYYRKPCTCGSCDNRPYAAFLPQQEVSEELPVLVGQDHFVLDVGLQEGGYVVSAIEVLHTHRVDDRKWNALKAQGLDVIEVATSDVIDDGYNVIWKPGLELKVRRASKESEVCAERRSWFQRLGWMFPTPNGRSEAAAFSADAKEVARIMGWRKPETAPERKWRLELERHQRLMEDIRGKAILDKSR